MEKLSSSFNVESNGFRPLADFPVTIWEDPSTFSSISDTANHTYEEKRNTLKEKAKELLVSSKANVIENIKIIDALCRLGLSYHFEKDIEEQLEKIFQDDDIKLMMRSDEFDLCTSGIWFQVFRQFGYKMSSDVFKKFKNKDGKFMEELGEDARGILSLYEAAQWSIHGEDILDEALVFSRSHLERLAGQCSPHLTMRINNALKYSYHKNITRIDTRQYISHYEEEASHNDTLLEFAKVDFNFLQLLHQEELTHVCRWYKELELDARLPYTKNRMVESYLWALGTYYEPQYSRARILLAKTVIILVMLDDTYDAYGTLEELDQFTDALERWDPTAIKGLPESMKYLHGVILEFFDKVEEEMEQEGRHGCGFHAKRSVIFAAKGYNQEAKWMNENHVATFDEYKEKQVVMCAYYAAIASSFFGMADIAKLDAFEWLSSFPKLLAASQLISRFMDDIVSHEFEHERKHVSTTIDCYMKQYGVSKEKAVEEIEKVISDLWKDLNEELMRPHAFPLPLLMRVLNITRVAEVFYKYQDSFTNSVFLKDHVVSLFIEKISM